MISPTIAVVTAIEIQQSCGVCGLPENCIRDLAMIRIFKIAILFIGLDSLMTCTHDLTVLTKTKEMTHYCGSFGYSGKDALDKCLYRSNGVSVPAEDG
jgi:hypothetical protein